MKMRAFAGRTMKEILRDPLNLAFGLGFPVVLILLLSAIQANVPVALFEIDRLTPGITSNPTVCALPDGRFMMIYKGSAPHPAYKNGVVSHGAAFADSPVGPWARRDKPVFSVKGARFSAEDPCLFYWNGALHCVMKDMGRYYCPDEERALVHFTSRDLGESWQKGEPFVFSTRRVPFEEGGEREIARLERPFVYQEDGAPAMFFAAAKPDADRDAAYNVHRRIAVSE